MSLLVRNAAGRSGFTTATDALPIIQALAGLVAIVAGLFAIAYHYKRLQA